MKPWPWVWLCLISFTSLADTAIKPGCQRLELVLAKTLTPAAVDTEWANGNTRNDEPAVLELRGCQGELRDRLVLASSLAKLDPRPLRGTAVPNPPNLARLVYNSIIATKYIFHLLLTR